MTFQMCAISIALLACGTMSCAAVVPLGKPGMAVRIEAGDYTVRGQTYTVKETVELPIGAPERVKVAGEEHVLSDERPEYFIKGTTLAKTLGPVDTGTRLPQAIVPESVRVYSADGAATVYSEGKDYFLEHEYGGLSRIETGAIPKGAKVKVDYEVDLQRVDTVQISRDGIVSVKRGTSVPVCAEAPAVDEGLARLANIYVPYRTTAITTYNICPEPAKNLTWRNFIKVSGTRYLRNTLNLLKHTKPLTVVCWGDSVTVGGSSSSHDKCYVELLRARLKAGYPSSEINVVNAGIGGSNVDSRRDGFDKEVLAYNPDLITVEFVNNLGLTPERILSSHAEFIARARKANPKVEFIILTPHYVRPDWMGNFEQSVGAMRKAAADNKVALGDTANTWANLQSVGIPYETLLANVINHPNDLGHEFYAATLMALLTLGP